uniref:Uncharacterized protein n=1 Tax=Theileria annulata TaxID=5874 RepID=A0A3B0N4Q5_THEAN
MDNFTCDVKSVVCGGLNLNFMDQVLDIVGPLPESFSKISKNLEEACKKIDKLIISMKFEPSITDTTSKMDPLNKIGNATIDREMSEIKSECSKLISKWEMIQSEIEEISSNFKEFSLKMENSAKEIKSEKKEVVDDAREPLPTDLSGRRLSANKLIEVLRYFPVPMTVKRREEIQLRKDLIMAHYQYNSALRFLEELNQLSPDVEADELVRSATITVDNTNKILLSKCTELVEFNKFYREFIDRYLIMLYEPKSDSEDYDMEFEAMITKAMDTELGVGIEIKHEVEMFKKWTSEIKSAIKIISGKHNDDTKNTK